MLKKLPKYVVDRWKRIVDDWVYGNKSKEGSKYAEFVRFVSVEARIACGPVGNDVSVEHAGKRRQSLGESLSTKKKTKKSPSEARTFSASTEQPLMKKCVKCQGEHAVTSCQQVVNMPLQERKRMVADLRLCRGCLKKGHLWRNCTRKARCEKCGRLHPTLLHDPEIAARETADPERAATCLQAASSACHCLVLPVMLSNKKDPEHKVLVYALLDAQSDACFVSKSACTAVNATGRRTRLELSTIAGRSTIDSEVVEDLVIQPLHSDEDMQLPTCYTRKNIPCSRNSISRRETALKWSHLTGIADQILEVHRIVDFAIRPDTG